MPNNQALKFKDLTPDILTYIFNNLSINDNLNCALVNSSSHYAARCALANNPNIHHTRALSDLLANTNNLSLRSTKAISSTPLYQTHSNTKNLDADFRLQLIQRDLKNNKKISDQNFLFLQLCLTSGIYKYLAHKIFIEHFNSDLDSLFFAINNFESALMQQPLNFLETCYAKFNPNQQRKLQETLLAKFHEPNEALEIELAYDDELITILTEKQPYAPRISIRLLDKKYPIIVDLAPRLIATNDLKYLKLLSLVYNQLAIDHQFIIYNQILHLLQSYNTTHKQAGLLYASRIFRYLNIDQKKPILDILLNILNNIEIAQTSYIIDKIYQYIPKDYQSIFFDLFIQAIPLHNNLTTFIPTATFFKLSNAQKNILAEKLVTQGCIDLKNILFDERALPHIELELQNLNFLYINLNNSAIKQLVKSRINLYLANEEFDFAFTSTDFRKNEINIYKILYNYLDKNKQQAFIFKLLAKLNFNPENIQHFKFYLKNFIDLLYINFDSLNSEQKLFLKKNITEYLKHCLNNTPITLKLYKTLHYIIFYLNKMQITDQDLLDSVTLKITKAMLESDTASNQVADLPNLISHVWPTLPQQIISSSKVRIAGNS